MIEAIIKYAGDEFESPSEYIKLAMNSEEELLDELLNILEFYHKQQNDE
jgi:hypothetical protein